MPYYKPRYRTDLNDVRKEYFNCSGFLKDLNAFKRVC